MLTLQEIREQSDEQFEKDFDNASKNVVAGYGVYVELFKMRENEKANKCMKKWTIAIGVMTAMILVLTIVNVLLSFYC